MIAGNLANSGIMVSGASGFVGAAFVEFLRDAGHRVIGLVRQDIASSGTVSYVRLQDSQRGWVDHRHLEAVGLFVHLAARTHSADLRNPAAEAIYRHINIDMTLALANACAQAGVRRFIFLSSVKAAGERTCGVPMRETDVPRPEDLYGMTKLEAENRLLELGAKDSMEIVVLRPPLVYGVGVKANFLRLMRLVHAGIPLPFGSVRNRRSMIGLPNLVDVLYRCAQASAELGGRYFVADGEDHSTGDLVRMIATAMRREPRLVAVSPNLMRGVARLIGKEDLADRLMGDLQVDTGTIRSRLAWQPRFTTQVQMKDAVEWFLRVHQS